MGETKALPPSPHPQHTAKNIQVKPKTYSTSHIFKKRPQKPVDAHGRGNVVWADKQGRRWLRQVEQKEKEKQRKVQEMHPLASEFNETLSNSRSTILENSLSALNIASGNLQTRLETTSQAFNASMALLVDFHNTQLRLPLEESQIFKIVESQLEAAGFEKQGGSQVVKQHATTLSASMNEFRKKLATQKQTLEGLKKERDAAQDETCMLKSEWEKASVEEEKVLRAEVDNHVRAWEDEIKAASEVGIKRCKEIEETFVKKKREASAALERIMADDDD